MSYTKSVKRKGPGKSFRKGISLIEAVQRFSDETKAEAWFISTRWPNGTICPFCEQKDRVIDRLNRKPQPWYCGRCRRYFSIKTNTIMHSSRLPLSSWAIAFFLLSTNLKGVSSLKLHRDLNVTQRTAWHMAMRIRETLIDEMDTFHHLVEADETYIGGSDRTRHKHKRSPGRGTTDKIPVAGLKERNTNRVHARVLPNTRQRTLKDFVERNTAENIILLTDQSAAYNTVNRRRISVNHSTGEYVRGMAHTNGLESFWAMLDRAYMGTFHKISRKHLHRYVGEFQGRHNRRPLDTDEQISTMARKAFGRRLRYKDLTADPEDDPP